MYNFVLKKAFFDAFWLFMQEQIVMIKLKKNRRNLRKIDFAWLVRFERHTDLMFFH